MVFHPLIYVLLHVYPHLTADGEGFVAFVIEELIQGILALPAGEPHQLCITDQVVTLSNGNEYGFCSCAHVGCFLFGCGGRNRTCRL